MTQQQPGQWLASRLIGTTVVSANNESIGDVNDVLMDRNGQTVAVVVGVGGFLGIGEKNVAVPFSSLEFTSRQTASASGAAGTGTGSATGTSTGMGSAGTGPSGSTAGGTAATTGSTTAPGGVASTSASTSDAPERIMLRMSKQDLQNAPQFMRTGAASTSGSGTSGGSTGTGGSAGTAGTGAGGTGAAGTGASGTAPRQ